MGMFDIYRPAREQRCPVCGRMLQEWQGKDGPNALFVWAEGSRHPVEQVVDEELRIDQAAREQFLLPMRFEIYSYDCPEHRPIEAECRAPDGIWTEIRVRPFTG